MSNYSNNCTILDKNLRKVQDISPHIKAKTSQASVLMLLNAILMGLLVVIGAYAPRYRRHPVVDAVFLGATALFLPIVSTIVTTTRSLNDLIQIALKEVLCFQGRHLYLVFAWTAVVVVIGINTSAVVAGDAREGRNLIPPILLLVKASWSAYLTFSTLGSEIAIVQLFVIMFAKLLLQYAAFFMARRSFALGRNPRLIAGYMAELQQPVHDGHTLASPSPPALIVIGEDKVKVEEQPHGYNLKQMPDDQGNGDTTNRANNLQLVTLDRVWGLQDMDIILGTSAAQHKDLCFSFALFKLLRCRFAKYTVSEAGFIKSSKFFWETLLQGDDYDRVFRIIRDELSFINDYYFSSLPIYYSHTLLPAFGIMLSLWSIGYSLWLVVVLVYTTGGGNRGQINCWLSLETQNCNSTAIFGLHNYRRVVKVGSLYYDIVPLYLAIAVLVLAEVREIVSYIYSNWTKVALICHHVNKAWWQRSRVVKKCICCLLKGRRCKLVNNWDDKMKQCSILELRPRKTPLLLRRLLRSLDRGKKVEVQSTVKDAIFKALKVKVESFTTQQVDHGAAVSYIGPLSPPVPPLSLNDGCSGKKQPGYTILVWQIATSVFEVSHSRVVNASQLPHQPSKSDDKTVATHLSRYCTYLVSSRPELLPDDAEWCRKLYDQVKKDADRVLAKVQGVDNYNHFIQELKADSNHEVLRNGAMLGDELVKHYSAMGWQKLSSFWVETILYVAPSENLEAHVEAISHGGELITLLWAMLAHAGITSRLAAEEGSGIC